MNPKVLIIDDDKVFVFLMAGMIAKQNRTVFVAHTLEEGMLLLEDCQPDIVFLDNQLTDGSGWSKAEYILETYPNIQLNLMSAVGVPKTSANSFRIIEKDVLLDELRM